jgi:hypothetical protein
MVEDVALVGPAGKICEDITGRWKPTCATTLVLGGWPRPDTRERIIDTIRTCSPPAPRSPLVFDCTKAWIGRREETPVGPPVSRPHERVRNGRASPEHSGPG